MKTIKKAVKKLFGKSKNINFDANTAQYLYEITQKNAIERMDKVGQNDLAHLTFQYDSLNENFDKAKLVLNENGIVIVENSFSEENSNDVYNNFKKIEKEAISSQKVNDDIETYNYFIDVKGKRFKSYSDRADFSKAIFRIRSGADKGMIDVFNYDFIDQENGKKLSNVFENPLILKLINLAGNKTYNPENLNIYYNKSILQTRGFHVDSFSKGQMKAFIYLTDVIDTSYGPYSYVLKSNSEDELEKFNKSIAAIGTRPKTDAYFFDIGNAYPIIGKKGTLVISDQGGIHRGHPQKEGKERMVAVMNYKVS